MSMNKLVWNQIDKYHHIAQVPGGWMFKAYADVAHMDLDGFPQSGWDWRVSITFIPDPSHMYAGEWVHLCASDVLATMRVTNEPEMSEETRAHLKDISLNMTKTNFFNSDSDD